MKNKAVKVAPNVPNITVTPEMVQAVLLSLSAVDLNKHANERKMEAVKEDIETYLKTDKEQTERVVLNQLPAGAMSLAFGENCSSPCNGWSC